VDGATIHFKAAGRGPVLLLLPGVAWISSLAV
jgi:hypothetical protein